MKENMTSAAESATNIPRDIECLYIDHFTSDSRPHAWISLAIEPISSEQLQQQNGAVAKDHSHQPYKRIGLIILNRHQGELITSFNDCVWKSIELF
jgi:hypothetical protein